MERRICLYTAVAVILSVWSESAAQPTQLSTCVTSQPPVCSSDSRELFESCSGRLFLRYRGRAAWFPLQYVSPITIEIEGRETLGDDFPVYVEIVPLAEIPPSTFCFDGHPGIVVGIFRGAGLYCGGGWERFGPVWLDAYVQPGGLYALQLTWFRTQDYGTSPAIDCLRIVTGGGQTSAVLAKAWGEVRALYR